MDFHGARNLAPYSYFNVMGMQPFYVAFGSVGTKDTLRNLEEVPEFVCNIATVDLMDVIDFTATDFPPGEDEFAWSGLTPVPSAKVRPPRVGEAKAHLECEVAQIVREGRANIVLGRIVHAHVIPGVWKDGRVDPRLLDPLGRLAGSGYASLGDLYSIKRAAWTDVAGRRGADVMPRAVKVAANEE
jgi:flavin reductase (DIM6/NTAB) family NADH-FMN oxidoreductase RutF